MSYDKLHTGIYLAYKPVEYSAYHEDMATAQDTGDRRNDYLFSLFGTDPWNDGAKPCTEQYWQ